jgi:hypothetical protein
MTTQKQQENNNIKFDNEVEKCLIKNLIKANDKCKQAEFKHIDRINKNIYD